MDPILMNALIGGGAVLISCLGAKILDLIFPANRRKDKKVAKDNSKSADTSVKVDNKTRKTAPVTINTEKLIELIELAEQHESFTSIEKLDFVLTKYQQYCIDNNFKFIKEVIVENVNELISLTKKVNKRDKDIKAEEAKPEQIITAVEVVEEPKGKGIYQ